MTDAAPATDEDERERFGSLGSTLHLLVLVWGAFLGLLPLNDNSFFTHLATGRLILERGSVPSSDPYTFTALGEPWTVQSWLASVAYAGAERLGGVTGVRVLVVLVFVVAASLVWRLTRASTSLIPRLLLAAVAMVVCSGVWSERPYMVGFIGLCLVWLALEGRFPHWWLVPYVWLWANSHGSFPLGLMLVVAVAAGTALDQRRRGDRVEVRHELVVLRSLLLGLAAAVVSPLGFRALTFPLEALTRPDTFGLIVEWQAPRFTSPSERAFLVLAVAAVASTIVSRRWRQAVPVLVFFTAGLVAQRNLVMAVPVLVPVAAAGLPTLGTLRSGTRPALGRPLALVPVALGAVVVAASLGWPALGLGGYPTRPLDHVADRQLEGRLVTQDFTGNLLEALDGAEGTVFIDDRADMFPDEVIEDYRVLNTGEPGWADVLDDRRAEAIVWSRSHPLGSIIAADRRWRVELSDAEWFLAVRR